jgi:hypothetical protein
VRQKFSQLKDGLIKQYEDNLKPVVENLEASVAIFKAEK